MPKMLSPCVDICSLSEETGHCEGCGRSLREIAYWSGYSDAERQRIMDELPARRQALAGGGR